MSLAKCRTSGTLRKSVVACHNYNPTRTSKDSAFYTSGGLGLSFRADFLKCEIFQDAEDLPMFKCSYIY